MCASDCIRFKMRDTGNLIRKHQKTINESNDEREINAALRTPPTTTQDATWHIRS